MELLENKSLRNFRYWFKFSQPVVLFFNHCYLQAEVLFNFIVVASGSSWGFSNKNSVILSLGWLPGRETADDLEVRREERGYTVGEKSSEDFWGGSAPFYCSIPLTSFSSCTVRHFAYRLSFSPLYNTTSLASSLSSRLRVEAQKTLKDLSNVNQARSRTDSGTWSSDTKSTVPHSPQLPTGCYIVGLNSFICHSLLALPSVQMEKYLTNKRYV